MKFGKLTDISHVNFMLPEDHPATLPALQKSSETLITDAPRVLIGSARWGERDLIGKIYPPKTPAKDYLSHYSRHFTTIELNSTHYQLPSVSQVEQWCEKAEPQFTFCPKIPQIISHRPDFGSQLHATEQLLPALKAFGSQLGLPFLQLPPTFTPQHGKSLFEYLARWPQDMPLAIEFRHPDWFSQHRIRDRAFHLLEEHNLSTVITDTAGRRDVIHMRLTNARVMVRFVGNRLHHTDYLRIDTWVRRLQQWMAEGLQEVYFIVHQPEETLCVDLAIYLIRKLNQECGLKLPAPKPLEIGQQQQLF
uniref:DUF72 domain-containing protein n=1 Tax=Roseihalotalea indica TaxID=2867963 RepID=A0AA49GHX3_9BACT|nr:DUF72 domain-containing protein [Tunicatimonas sp. TK19036]